MAAPPPPTVLVIEDDDDVRELLLAHARALGWDAAGEASGAAGFACALATRPHLVIVDILLPDIDGRQVVRALRRDSRTARCRVLLNSVLDLEDFVDAAIELQVDGVLPKPFTRRDVAASLDPLWPRPAALASTDIPPTGISPFDTP